MEKFKVSTMWVANFMRRNHIQSSRENGQSGHHDAQTVFNARKALKKSLRTNPIFCVSNTDEVAVLYRTFPSCSIRNVNDPATNNRIKDRLTAVLTVYDDGKKAPLKASAKRKGLGAFHATLMRQKTWASSTNITKTPGIPRAYGHVLSLVLIRVISSDSDVISTY